MDVQTLVALLIVAAAVVYVARRSWRTMRASRAGDAGCGSSCGCEPSGAPTPTPRDRS
jgi:hypothetical protein